MEEWKKIRKRYLLIEIVGIMGIIVCFIVGSFLDWSVLVRKDILIGIKDIESFSLTILQIQAAVGTLIIAIIALIAGNISDSYMGVSVSDFYLNIKPWKLKQKILTFISLGLCLLGIAFHALHLYNSVFCVFVATLISIVISIIEIYSAFKGENAGSMEIESYINYVLKSKVKFSKKENILENFVSDWKKIIDTQDKQSFEKYLEIFEKYVVALLNYETEQSVLSVQKQCYNMAYCLLGSEKNITKERGLGFVQRIYDVLWEVIYINKDRVLNRYKNSFYFFSEICDEFVECIDALNVENVERKVKFNDLSDSIQRIAIWSRYDVNEKENNKEEIEKARKYKVGYETELNQLHYFARYIGYYLKKQEIKGNIVNYDIWANSLKGWSMFSASNIPEERSDDFLKDKVVSYFNYCYGMLRYGKEDIVKAGLYLNGIKNIVKLENKYQALLYLAVHCYIYYLAERESDDCVVGSVKQAAQNMINDKDVQYAFVIFLRMLAENSEWLDLDLKKQLETIVERYEMFPIHGNIKSMIIKNVASDFYIFIILFMSEQYFLPELLDKNIDDRTCFGYVTNGSENDTKNMLKSLYKIIFVGNKSDDKIDVQVGLMYDSLEKMVKKKQKERYVKVAEEQQKKYEEIINENEICMKIKDEAIKKINEKFSAILTENDERNDIIEINLLKLDGYTDSVQKLNLDGYYSDIDGMFLAGIVNFLYQQKVVDVKRRFEDFSGDSDFMKYISTNQLHLLMGSQYILKNRDYKINDKYKKFLEQYDTIYTAVVNNGIGLKKGSVQICLHDINVSIHSPSIAETDAEYDKKTGKYNYSIMKGLPM